MRRFIAAALLLSLGAAVSAQTIIEERRQLDRARVEADAARRRSARLDAEAARLRDEAASARQRAAAIAARIQAAEADVAAARARLRIAQTLRRAQERRLADKQQPIARLIAALQTLARRPAAAAIVQPGTLSDLVHVRAVLTTVMPRVRRETAELRAELDRARALRAQAAAALAALQQAQAERRTEQTALARLDLEQRRRAAQLSAGAGLEAERALALGEQARDLQDLVARLDDQAQLRDTLAALPGPLPRPVRPGEAPPPPAPAPAESALAYRMPAIGTVVRSFGDRTETGLRSRGLTLKVQPGAIVVAPASGRVSFAGPYRGYGRIVILDHGGGWTTLITGLDAVSARAGDAIEPGSPLGRAAAQPISLELRRGGQPVDVAQLLG